MARQGPLSGEILSERYRLGELLGQGGFGAVYRAENLLLQRPQAIKVLLGEHFSDPRFLERFLREARTLAALDHPNIVHVDELGMQGTLIYLVMPLLSGGTLQDRLQRQAGPLPLAEVGHILEQICAALDYAHQRGVVHLDLKPLNLLVHADGRLLLSDFGLAHLMEQGALEGGTSLSFGSPLYMAPEHVLGHPDWRSDLYALGIILYQMLTGRVPFIASAAQAVLFKQVSELPPPLRAVRPDLPTALEAVVATALAKQPEARYQMAGELLAAFKTALVGQMGQPMRESPSMANAPTRLSSTQFAAPSPGMSASTTPAARARTGPISPASNHLPGYPSALLDAPTPRMAAAGTSPAQAHKMPRRSKIWTPGFSWLFLGLVVASGGLTAIALQVGSFFITAIGCISRYPDNRNYSSFDGSEIPITCTGYSPAIIPHPNLLILLLPISLLGLISLLGSLYARSWLIRASFLLQAISVATLLGLVLTGFVFLTISFAPNDGNTFVSVANALQVLAVATFVFTHISIGCLAAATSRRPSAERAKRISPAGFPPPGQRASNPVRELVLAVRETLWEPLPRVVRLISWALFKVLLFILMLIASPLLLLRPGSWKQWPVTTACLLCAWGLLGFIAASSSRYDFTPIIHFYSYDSVFSSPVVPYTVIVFPTLLLLLGFLVLAQTERVYKKMEQQQAAPKQRL